uniref:Uncharacterized protein n=1 Tax=Aegilops tauschii subsp. strangulata TaxID=200361 RepID=A0A453FX77_AEGTS
MLSLLCTPEVGSKLGPRGTANCYANPATTSDHQAHVHAVTAMLDDFWRGHLHNGSASSSRSQASCSRTTGQYR